MPTVSGRSAAAALPGSSHRRAQRGRGSNCATTRSRGDISGRTHPSTYVRSTSSCVPRTRVTPREVDRGLAAYQDQGFTTPVIEQRARGARSVACGDYRSSRNARSRWLRTSELRTDRRRQSGGQYPGGSAESRRRSSLMSGVALDMFGPVSSNCMACSSLSRCLLNTTPTTVMHVRYSLATSRTAFTPTVEVRRLEGSTPELAIGGSDDQIRA